MKADTCPVCTSVHHVKIAEEIYSEELFEISRCSNCTVLFTSYSSKDYNINYHTPDESKFNGKYGAILKGNRLHDRHENYLEEVALVCEHFTRGRYLDIGCNAGWLLGYLQKHTALDLYGLEPSHFLADLTAKRLNIKVYNDYVREGVLEKDYFDFISLTDVFEHIPKPHEVLQVARDALKKNGKIMIKVPNGDFSLLKYRLRFLGNLLIRRQDVFDAKEHFIHYNKSALEYVLRNNGFKIVSCIVPKPIQTAGSKKATILMRSLIYRLAKLGMFPPQDILCIAEKAR